MLTRSELLDFLQAYLQSGDDEDARQMARSPLGHQLYPGLLEAVREASMSSTLSPDDVGAATNRYFRSQVEVDLWLRSLADEWS